MELPMPTKQAPMVRRSAAGRIGVFVLAFVAFAGPVSLRGPRSIPVCRRCRERRSSLGPAPGAGGGQPWAGTPPATGRILGGRAGPSLPKAYRPRSPRRGGAGPTAIQKPVTRPQPQPVGPTSAPFSGTLELPAGTDDGPARRPDARQAIDVTLERSLDLRQKFIEIPLARADILQASLRANPSSTRTGSSSNTAIQPAARAARSSSTPTSPIRSTSPTSGRPARWWPPAPRRSSRPSTRTRSVSGSTTSTPLSSTAPECPPDAALCPEERQGPGEPRGRTEELFTRAGVSQANRSGGESAPDRPARPDRRGGRLPQGQARPGIADEPLAEEVDGAEDPRLDRRRGPPAAAGRGAAADRPGRTTRHPRLPPRRLAGPGRRPAGQGQRLQRHLSSSGSPIPSRTTAPTGSRAPRPGHWA